MGELNGRTTDNIMVPNASAKNIPRKGLVRSPLFKYYIHDSADAFRFQLFGELTDADVSELNGCWRTAQTSLRNRKLILDLRDLKTVDELGKQWLAAMGAEGAAYLPDSYPKVGLSPRVASEAHKAGVFSRLFAWIRGSRVVPAQSSTQAQ